jgi:hypothetical protein
MNDAQELIYGTKRIVDALKQVEFANFLDFEDLQETVPGYVYAACFSERVDDLSQWRAYSRGSGGVCLHFDLSNQPLIKVIYDPAAQDLLIEAFISDVRAHAKTLPGLGSDEEVTDNFHLDVWTHIQFLAAALKDAAFSSEQEWRLVVGPGLKSEHIVRKGRSTLVPARPISIEGKLTAVTTGPCDYDDLAMHAARLALPAAVRGKIKVHSSRIPYRDW